MKAEEVQKEIDSFKSRNDFDGLREYLSVFDVVYKIGKDKFGRGIYTDNDAARNYNGGGSCVNSYIECEDGYIEYPF